MSCGAVNWDTIWIGLDWIPLVSDDMVDATHSGLCGYASHVK